jgi:putative ABC transport system permease protein
MVFYGANILSRLYSVQLKGNDISAAVQEIKHQYEASFPGNPFDYYFQDEFFNRQYASEHQFEKIFILLSCLAVLIACLGLWGLTSFTTSQRIKEISIRKVLGASITNIVSILSWQYLKLILLASVVALPVTLIVAPGWLANFAFHMSLTPDIILIPLIFLSTVAFITVSTQVFKAATTNPAKALKSE